MPPVLLLGWLGATHKQLAKYTALMVEQGCVCVQVLQPPATVFTTVEGPPRRFAANVSAFLQDKDLVKKRQVASALSIQPCCHQSLQSRISLTGSNCREVLFYIFSNGGAILYQYIKYIALAFQEGRYITATNLSCRSRA